MTTFHNIIIPAVSLLMLILAAPVITIALPGALPEIAAAGPLDPYKDGTLPPVDRADISFSFEMEIDITPRIVQYTYQDSTYDTVDLKEDAIDCGPCGTEEHYVVSTFAIQGMVLNVRAELSGEVLFRAWPAPFIVPGPISMGVTMVHPEWKGPPSSVLDERVETVLISSDDSKGVRTYAIRSFPVRYEPDGTAIVHTKVLINVTWSPLKAAATVFANQRKPLGPVDYLMITDESLSDQVQSLADWKSQKGVLSRVVTVQDISKMYRTGDEQSKVRSFILEMEKQYDIDYLLLVGDYDKVKTRTTRNIHPETTYGEPSTFATDGYFACVDNGTTWDGNGNKLYAEGGEIDDPIPDMAVGRLAINDPQVLSSVIDGLISREMSPTFSDVSREAIFMAGDPQSVPGDPTVPMEYFWSEYCDDVLDGRETLYYDGSGSLSYSSSSFRSVVGTGQQAICYFSHGTQTGLPNLFSNNQVGTLADTGPDGSIFVMACLTAWFDDPNQGSMGSFTDCFGEVMTETSDRGVVGYIGSCRLAVGGIDTEYSGDAPGLEEDYWRGIRKAVNGEVPSTVGDVYRYAITHFSESFYPFPSNYYDYTPQRTFLEYNLLGEPEAPLFFRSPEELRMDHTLSPSGDWALVRVTNRTGAPMEGATVTLYRAGEIGVRGLTDDMGYVNISIPDSNGGTVNLTAWKLGDIPALDTIELPDELEPQALYTISPEVPDGLEGYYLVPPEITIYADEDASMQYNWDGGALSPCPYGTVISAPEGVHELTFVAMDRTGWMSSPVTVNVSVDLTPPHLMAVTDPMVPDGEHGWFISPPSVNLTSDETIYELVWRKGSGSFGPFTGPAVLGEGEHNLDFTARDSHGNFNTTSLRVLVDLELPYSVMNVSYPPDGKNGYYVTQPTIRLEAFDDRSANTSYRWDQGPWQNYLMPIRPSKGVHFLEYKAMDVSGNEELPVNKATFRYDPDLPMVEVAVTPGSPDGDNGFYVSKPSVTFNASDETSGPDVEVFAALSPPGEGVDWGRYGFPTNGTLWVSDGEWLLYVFARDLAGNVRSLPPVPLKVDTDRPSMLVSLYPKEPDGLNGWYVTQPVIWLNGSSPDSVVRVFVDSEAAADPLVDILGLPEGVHTVEVYPMDGAGNEGENWTFSYRCDLTDPTAVLMVNKYTFRAGEPVELSAKPSADVNGIMAYRFHLSDGRSTLWMDSPDWNWTFVEEGFWSAWVQVSDMSGRTSTSERREINITVPPPPPDDNGTDDDDDVPPGPVDDDDGTDEGWDLDIIIKLALAALLVLAIAVLTFSLIRRRSIQEVEWEDDDSDEELEELDSIDEAEVLEEMGDDFWDQE